VLLLVRPDSARPPVALHRLGVCGNGPGPGCAPESLFDEGLRPFGRVARKDGGQRRRRLLYDGWARWRSGALFASCPSAESQDVASGVIRIKRDPALRPVLAELRRDGPDGARGGGIPAYLWDRVLMDSGGILATGLARAWWPSAGHTHVQFSNTAEEEFAHVDAERLVTVDGRSIETARPGGRGHP